MIQSLSTAAYKRGISLKKAKKLYKRQIQKISRCLFLYRYNNDIVQEVCAVVIVRKPLNTFILLQKLLNMDIVKAVGVKPETLLYILADKKYRADKLFKLPSKVVSFVRNNIYVQDLKRN